jgi:arabinosyltransferase C
VDRAAADEDPGHPLWRSVGLDAAQIPSDADRVRIRAVDARTDPRGWLAFTGPRRRSVVPLTEFLASHGPVLVSWPQSFLFPCLHDIPTVAGGLAQAPRAVIEGPRPSFGEESDQSLGGSFAALVAFGQLYEVPTRLAGHPEVDWGALRVSGDTAARDVYQRSTTRVLRPGRDDRWRISQVRSTS